jgi:23S rRNA (uracil1939-C5)-methyltransferase
VEKLVYGGDGLSRLDGRVVFAPYVLPGERIEVQAVREKPGMIKARTLKVLEPAAQRVKPECRYFGRCGGCHYQHASYGSQLEAKKAIVVEELRRLGHVEAPAETGVVAGEPWGYRNRVQLHVENGGVGYREAGSHKLCAVDHCPIASPAVNRTIATLAAMARDSRWPRFVRSIEIFTDEESVQLNVLETDRPVALRFFEWCGEQIPGLVGGHLDYLGRFRVSGHSFFQVNRFLTDRLVEAAVGEAAGETALDLYAGVGLFTMALAQRFASVRAVESGAAAARDLEFNAQRAGLGNVQVKQGSAEAFLGGLEAAPDLVLLDPPRSGLGKPVVEQLVRLKPAQIVLVACDPATLARDLAKLLASGYSMERMTVVDLFPQTYHVETVVGMRRAG